MPVTPAELFERHHLALYRYLLRMTGSLDEAEELTQEVFLRVVKGLDGYEERNKERAWLFRIARNLRRDSARRERCRLAASSLDEAEVAVPAGQPMRVILLRALAELADDDCEAFVLGEIAGLTYAEIADVCATTPAAVRSRIYRARTALRAALDSQPERSVIRGSDA